MPCCSYGRRAPSSCLRGRHQGVGFHVQSDHHLGQGARRLWIVRRPLEFLLVCTRGSCVPDRLTPAIDSDQTIQKSRVHSQKPDQFYEIIERLYDGPYLESFARRPRAGWTSFGNDPALTEVV